MCCGDAHVSNFGLYAAPHRSIVFDLNDFDEAAVAPAEWDVKRLITSAIIGGRHAGYPAKAIRRCVEQALTGYQTSLAGHARGDECSGPLLPAGRTRALHREGVQGPTGSDSEDDIPGTNPYVSASLQADHRDWTGRNPAPARSATGSTARRRGHRSPVDGVHSGVSGGGPGRRGAAAVALSRHGCRAAGGRRRQRRHPVLLGHLGRPQRDAADLADQGGHSIGARTNTAVGPSRTR